MSYDVSFMADVGGDTLREVADAGNMTWNVGPMFAKALGYGLSDLDGRRAGDVLPDLERGVAHMEAHPDEYTPLNPPNKWGSYESALRYLRGIRDLARECPATLISVS